jgi:hypothetical protein
MFMTLFGPAIGLDAAAVLLLETAEGLVEGKHTYMDAFGLRDQLGLGTRGAAKAV